MPDKHLKTSNKITIFKGREFISLPFLLIYTCLVKILYVVILRLIMFLKESNFFNHDGMVNVPNYLDKTSYISVIEDARTQGMSALGLSAPLGLGATTFAKMVASFYGLEQAETLFKPYVISKSPVMTEAGKHLVLYYDLSKLEQITPNDFLQVIATETRTYLAKLIPNIKLDKNDVSKMLKQFYTKTGKTIVIIFAHFEQVKLCQSWVRFEVLTKVQKFFNELWSKLHKANALHLMLFTSAFDESFTMLASTDGNSYFTNLSSRHSDFYVALDGWCGVTRDELATLMSEPNAINMDELYDWCGGYDHGVMRFESVFRSLAEQDLIITTKELPSLKELIDTVNSGYCRFLPCGEIGIAALLNGEPLQEDILALEKTHLKFLTITLLERNKLLSGLKKLRSYINLSLVADGLCIVQNGDYDYDGENCSLCLANREMELAAFNNVNAEDCYLNDLCSIAQERNAIRDKLASRDWINILGDVTLKYLEAQRRCYGQLSLTIAHAMSDLLNGIDPQVYQVIPFDNFILFEAIDDPRAEKFIIVAGENHGLNEVKDYAVSLYNSDVELANYLSEIGYDSDFKPKLTAYCYDFKLPSQIDEKSSYEFAEVEVRT